MVGKKLLQVAVSVQLLDEARVSPYNILILGGSHNICLHRVARMGLEMRLWLLKVVVLGTW